MASGLPKSRTGIAGLDEVTYGGLPQGRPTLICGGAGCGKTLFALEFLVRGATDFGEPGVFVSFEESAGDLAANVAALGFDLVGLENEGKLLVDQVRIRREEIEETGDYDLEGLFVRLGWAIEQVGAKRVALDTIEALFAGLSDQGILRAELRRLFEWLKERGITAVITAERGDGALTRHGLEEYVSDCVLLLDHRVYDQVTTRRLRVVKYRGSAHGTNEYPFLIDAEGLTVMPVTSLGLTHPAPTDRLTSGIDGLDAMLVGGGFYRGSSILVSGTAGTGKTSVAATFAEAACRRDERVLFFSFEESPRQLGRNMLSIGLDLDRWQELGRLRIEADRPTSHGLEAHLARMLRTVETFDPGLVVVDPVSALLDGGTAGDASIALLRLIDHLKARGVTAVLSALSYGDERERSSHIAMSSLMDAWILLRDTPREHERERERSLFVLKVRGMAHSNRARRFDITDHGIELTPHRESEELYDA